MLDRMTQLMTTAELRTEAHEFERALQWQCAAVCWAATADRYPGNLASALAQADIARIRARAESCRAMADQLARE